MSSFLDRWIYNSSRGSYSGTYNLTTGTYNTKSGTPISTTEKTEHYQASKSPGTTPNLRNVPYAYYKKEMKRNIDKSDGEILVHPSTSPETKKLITEMERRGSASSTSSEESL